MGIQGLIPFLEKTSRPVNVSQFSGSTAAIDAYCWLHKGVFSCTDKLAIDDSCDAYVHYCMKLVNTLLARNIKPILVFDGQKLPAKAGTEKKRKELRERNRKKAAELMRCDRGKEAQSYLRQSIDVTHKMALKLICACRARNVDCIVAPYEADAQLAYLNIRQIAQIIITEDSDLLLFGAKKVLFKMDVNGNGLLVEQENLHISMGVQREKFSLEKFRYMCILSGCDYLESLPGIGLARAHRFITRTVDPDIYRAIYRLGSHLNMPQIKVSEEYRRSFMDADFMFKYQPVFDPFIKKLVPLTPISSKDDENYDKFTNLLANNNLSDQQICNLAFGNLDPFTLSALDDWTPESAVSNKKRSDSKWNSRAPHSSIWDANYVPPAAKKSILAPSIDFGRWHKTSTQNVLQESNGRKRDRSDTRITTFSLPIAGMKNANDDHQQLRELKLIYANATCVNDDGEIRPSITECNEENQKENVTSVINDVELADSSQTNTSNRSALPTESGRLRKPELEDKAPLIISRYFSRSSNISGTEVKNNVDENDVKERENSEVPVTEKVADSSVTNAETDHRPSSQPHPYRPLPNDRSNASLETISKTSNPFCVNKRRSDASFAVVDENGSDDVEISHRTEATKNRTGIATSAFKWTDFSSNISNGNPEDAAASLKRVKLAPTSNNRGKDLRQLPSIRNNKTNCAKERPLHCSFPYTSSSSSNVVRRPENKLSLRPATTVTTPKCRTPGLTRTSVPKQPSLLSMFAFKKPEKLKV